MRNFFCLLLKLASYLAIMDFMNDYTQNLGYWIKQYSKLANQAMEDALRPYNIGRTQWYILYHIYHSRTLSQKDLQTQLQVESATLTKILSSLIRKNLVTQTQSKKDRRSKLLVLSPEGEEMWKSLPDPIDEVKARALKGIEAKDIEMARLVLQAAVHNLEGNEE